MKPITFDCVFARKVYHKDDFWILSVYVDEKLFPEVKHNKYGNVTLTGNNLFQFEQHVTYHITAVEESGKYGPSYKVSSAFRDRPSGGDDVKNFLNSILTQKQAETLYKNYPNIIDIVAQGKKDEIDVNKLYGIGPKTIDKIIQKITENFYLADFCAVFYNMITLNMMKKLQAKYHTIENIIKKLQKNPYTTLYHLDRVGFLSADKMILEMEREIHRREKNGEEVKFSWDYSIADSKDRCRNCMLYFLQQNEEMDGSTKVSIENLRAQVRAYASEAMQHFDECLNEDLFHIDTINQTVSSSETYDTELKIAQILIKALNNPVKWGIDTSQYTKVDGFELTEEQHSVQDAVCNNQVVLLQGPAGSGKSSSVKALADMLKDFYFNMAMACPSAKAAKVLTRYSNFDAVTIHRLLGCFVDDDGHIHFKYGPGNPLPYNIIIIDETSMLDVDLALKLLSAINFEHTKILFIGDCYQLPSVGAGNFFHDLLESKLFPTISLTKIFRYSEGGLIKVATDIRNSKLYLPVVLSAETKRVPFGQSYCFIPSDAENCVSYALQIYEKLAETYPVDDIMLITAQNKGEYGATKINNLIQKRINPNKTNGVTIECDDTKITFYKGDLVMNIVNDYYSVRCTETGSIIYNLQGEPELTLIANGETGRVVAVKDDALIIRYDNDYILRTKDSLKKVRLAYAESAHKSQGSSCQNVIVLTPAAHTFMMNSALLYVAVTRAKKCVFHIGDLKTVNNAIYKKPNLKRKTNLKDLLASLMEAYQYENSKNHR